MATPAVLVVGRSGQLASALAGSPHGAGLNVRCLGRPDVDLLEPGSIATALDRIRPDIVVNAAAYTAVDRAEEEPDVAMRINADAPGEIARWCAGRDVAMVHVSSDYVFRGDKDGAYVEDDPVDPQGAYARSKARGEDAVRDVLPQHVILRTAWVYAAGGDNFVRTMLRLGAERDELSIVDDQRGCPTFADDLADAILRIAREAFAGNATWGTYHAASHPPVTWFGFAKAIFARASEHGAATPRLRAISTAEFPTPARRPANSVLDCGKLQDDYGIVLPEWPDSLDVCIGRLLGARNAGTA